MQGAGPGVALTKRVGGQKGRTPGHVREPSAGSSITEAPPSAPRGRHVAKAQWDQARNRGLASLGLSEADHGSPHLSGSHSVLVSLNTLLNRA